MLLAVFFILRVTRAVLIDPAAERENNKRREAELEEESRRRRQAEADAAAEKSVNAR